jgi:hypothetical protein
MAITKRESKYRGITPIGGRYQIWQTRPETADSVETTNDYGEAIRFAEALVRVGNPAFIIDTTTHERILTRIRDL